MAADVDDTVITVSWYDTSVYECHGRFTMLSISTQYTHLLQNRSTLWMFDELCTTSLRNLKWDSYVVILYIFQ